MFELPNQAVNLTKLNGELVPLNLPGFRGTARLFRRLVDGAWQATEPYLLIKCDGLTRAQKSAVKSVLAAHDDSELPPESEGERLQRKVRDGIPFTAAEEEQILKMMIQRRW